MFPQDPDQTCPCGTNLAFNSCCSPYLSGIALAPTAEALMRSRYTAFSLGAIDYLIDTLAPERRGPNEASMLAQELRTTEWIKLEIQGIQAGTENDAEGQVEFNAYFKAADASGCLHERSNFRKDNDRWYYVDGEVEIR